MTRRATLFAHEKCSPAEAVHPIQPLLRGAVFPATPRANARLGPPVGSAKQRPPSRRPLRLGTHQKGAPAVPMTRERKACCPRDRAARSMLTTHRARAHNAPGAGLHVTTSVPGAATSRAPRPVTPVVGRLG